jgi:exosortase
LTYSRQVWAFRTLQLLAIFGVFLPILKEWWVLATEVDRVSYVILIPLLAAILAWRSSPASYPTEASDPRRNTDRVVIGLLGLSVGLLTLGSLAAIFTFSFAAFPVALAAWVASLGRAHWVRYAPSLVLLQLMTPPPLPLFDWVVPTLVKASGASAVLLLWPLDSSASWVGSELTYHDWTLVVAEACSGSGALLVYWVLVVFLGALFHMSARSVVFFLALAVPFTLLVNGIRIALTAIILDLWGIPAVTGAGHEILGQVIVILGAGVFAWLIDRQLGRSKRVGGAANGSVKGGAA